MYFIEQSVSDDIFHYGVKGMKWGRKRNIQLPSARFAPQTVHAKPMRSGGGGFL